MGASGPVPPFDLGLLANNGGPTDTLKPAVASPAVNAAASCGTRSKDQRGGGEDNEGSPVHGRAPGAGDEWVGRQHTRCAGRLGR